MFCNCFLGVPLLPQEDLKRFSLSFQPFKTYDYTLSDWRISPNKSESNNSLIQILETTILDKVLPTLKQNEVKRLAG